ncbi:interleukin-8 isoform X2 [Tachysurus ichikawai]
MKAATLTVLCVIIFALTAMLCEGRIEGKAERCSCQKKAQERINSEARNEGLPESRRKPRTAILKVSKRNRL